MDLFSKAYTISCTYSKAQTHVQEYLTKAASWVYHSAKYNASLFSVRISLLSLRYSTLCVTQSEHCRNGFHGKVSQRNVFSGVVFPYGLLMLFASLCSSLAVTSFFLSYFAHVLVFRNPYR